MRDAWITTAMNAIQRDFLPEDLQPLLAAHGIDGCVAVQADQSEAETNFLLACAARHPFVKGVVGWVDLRADNLAERIEQWSGQAALKGFRHIVQAEPVGFLQDISFLRGVEFILYQGYTYDLLVYAHQLPEAAGFLQRLPEVPIVIDHLAKPHIRERDFYNWEKSMAQFKNMPHVFCKVSGLVTEARWHHWTHEDFAPYLHASLDIFGPDRLIFGSDWPVCLLSGRYSEVVNIIESWLAPLHDHEKKAIMGANAVRFYHLEI